MKNAMFTPAPMSDLRRARLVALGRLHHDWVEGALKSAGFDSGRPGDYNQHCADVDADPSDEDAFHAKARVIMGLDPATGRRLES